MKIPQPIFVRRASFVASFAITLSSCPAADLTWTGANPATWDVATTANWDDAGATTWTNGDNAIFDTGAKTANIAGTGITVGNLTNAGGILTLRSITDNLGAITIKPGGATWNTGGGEIEFFNDSGTSSFDTPLSIATGDTLTIAGGGTFDAGQDPTGADWSSTGAILDATSATIVRGNAGSIGRFATVKLVAGSTFFHERNLAQIYSNHWEIAGPGSVTFDNRYAQALTLSGIMSGSATLLFKGLETVDAGGIGFALLNNLGNTFSGGIVVEGVPAVPAVVSPPSPAIPAINSLLQVGLGDGSLGAVPATLDVDNIILKNGGRFRLNGTTTPPAVFISMHPNRGITLDNGGVIIANGNAHTIAGPITGTGGLTMGVSADGSANTITLTNTTNDYTGGTNIVRGTLRTGVAGSLPVGTLLTIGGASSTNSTFEMNGFPSTVGGISGIGNSTRTIQNNGAAATTLTINVPANAGYAYGSLIAGSQAINIVKDGLGNQQFVRTDGYAKDVGNVTVNAGTLDWVVADSYGALTVNGGTLNLGRTVSAFAMTANPSSFTAAADSTTNYAVPINNWTGIAGIGFPALTVTGNLTIAAGSSFIAKVTAAANVSNFSNTNKSFTIGTVGGTASALGTLSVDSSGFLATGATGTWSLVLIGKNLVLNYTVGNAYDNWATTNITAIQPTAAIGFDQDPDSDGIKNGLEYILGGNPLAPGSASITSTLDADNLTITCTRATSSKTITTQTVQWSGDLVTWTDIVVPATDPDTVSIIIPRTNAVEGKLFTRLNVTYP